MTDRFGFDLNTGELAETGEVVSKFGSNTAVGTVSYEDVWQNGGLYNWLQASAPIRVAAGGDAADDAAGAGAQSVLVEGLGNDFEPITAVLPTAGVAAGPQSLVNFRRVNRARVLDVGAYGATNVGAIIIETVPGVVLANIALGLGQTQLALYTVPAGLTAYLRRVQVTSNAQPGGEALVRLNQRFGADVVAAPFGAARVRDFFPSVNGNPPVEYKSWPAFPEKTDIWFSAKGTTAPVSVAVSFDLLLVAPSGR